MGSNELSGVVLVCLFSIRKEHPAAIPQGTGPQAVTVFTAGAALQ